MTLLVYKTLKQFDAVMLKCMGYSDLMPQASRLDHLLVKGREWVNLIYCQNVSHNKQPGATDNFHGADPFTGNADGWNGAAATAYSPSLQSSIAYWTSIPHPLCCST